MTNLLQIEAILEEIGLTKSEISVYLSLLELGSSSTGKIVDKSKTSSSKIYEVLDKLIRKGLVSYIMKGGVKFFEAAAPERILDYMDEKKQQITSQTSTLQAILPQLKMKQDLANVISTATIYEGVKGLHTAFYDALRKVEAEKSEVLAINIFERTKGVERFFAKFTKDAASKGVKTKLIVNSDAQARAKGFENDPDVEIKFSVASTPASINIIGKTVIIFPAEIQDPLLIVIENKDVAEAFRTQFYADWNSRVTTYEGKKQIVELFSQLPELGHYDCFAEGMKIVTVLGEDNFIKWQNRKEEMNIKSRIIMGEKYKNEITVTKAHAEFKLIPGFENPGATLIFEDRVLNVILSENPIAFMVESKEVADNHRTYFNLTWNEDTVVRKGFDALWEMLKEFQGNSDATGGKVLGAAISENKNSKKYEEVFDKLTQYRRKNKKKIKLLFEQTGKNSVKKYSQNYVSPHEEVKYMPYKTDSPVEIYPDKEKVHLVIQDDEPTIITINNEKVSKAFEKQFDLLWNQDVVVKKGTVAVKELFDEMLQAGNCDLIGARGYFMDAEREWTKEWSKRAQKSGFTMRNIVDPKVKGHYITELPFARTKYTLQKEFVDLSVYWIYGEKVIMTNWDGAEPILIEITNPRIVEVYKKQFEHLWLQTVQTVYGNDEIMDVLESATHFDTYWIGGNSGAEQLTDAKTKSRFQSWMKTRIQNKKKMYDLVDFGSSLEGLEPNKKVAHKKALYEYKQLPEDLNSPMVIVLFDEYVLQIFWSKRSYGVLHKNKDMHESYMKQFNYFWKKG